MWVDRLVKVFQWLAFFSFAQFFISTHPYLFSSALFEGRDGWIILALGGVSLVVFGFWFTVIYVMSGKLEFIPPSIKPTVNRAFTKNTILYYFYLIPIMAIGLGIGIYFINIYLLEIPEYSRLMNFLVFLPIVLAVVAFFIKVYGNLRGKKK